MYVSAPKMSSPQVHARHFLNAEEIANVVVRACAWSDGGAEFIYGDGTVLSFSDHMNTFVALNPHQAAAPAGDAMRGGNDGADGERDMFFTAWTLSKYREKVTEALHIYNYYSPNARVIVGLTKLPCDLWRWRSPMEALVLAKDKTLLERRRVTAMTNTHVHSGTETLLQHSGIHGAGSSLSASGQSKEIVLGTTVTLWCALHRVSLTVHVNRLTFSVRWPAPAVHPNGSRFSFVAPEPHHDSDDGRCSGSSPMHATRAYSTLPIQKAKYFVWMEQVFVVAHPPPEWSEMLRIALELDNEIPEGENIVKSEADARPDEMEANANELVSLREDSTSSGVCHTRYQCLPLTAVDGNQCRFSKIRLEHANYLLASSAQLQSASCNREIHGPFAKVLWRYDADPSGREPHAIYWCLDAFSSEHGPASNPHDPLRAVQTKGSVLALVREDESILTVEPQGHGYLVQHKRCDSSRKCYHLSADGELSLPPVVGPLCFSCDSPGEERKEGHTHLVCSADLVSFVTSSAGPSGTSRIVSASPFYSVVPQSTAPIYQLCSRGRYLPFTGQSCIQLSQWNLAAARALEQASLHGSACTTGHPPTSSTFGLARPVDKEAAHAGRSSIYSSRFRELPEVPPDVILAERMDGSTYRGGSGCPAALRAAAAEGSVVFLSRRLDGIGTFTALTNGTIRCHFDDRTLVTLIPGVHDFDEENLVASCLFRDATRCVIRAILCAPEHPLFRYLSFALPFRRYVYQEAGERYSATRLEAPSPPQLDDTVSVNGPSASPNTYQSNGPFLCSIESSMKSAGESVHSFSHMALLQETVHRREVMEEETLLSLQSRAKDLLDGSAELSRVNHSLLYDDN